MSDKTPATGPKSDPTSNGSLPKGFEPGPAPPEATNFDHPDKRGKTVSVPGAGVERSGARADNVGDPDRNYKEGRNPREKTEHLTPPIHIAERERRDGVGSAESSAANGSVAPLSLPTGDQDPGPKDSANQVPGISDPNYSAAKYPDKEPNRQAEREKQK